MGSDLYMALQHNDICTKCQCFIPKNGKCSKCEVVLVEDEKAKKQAEFQKSVYRLAIDALEAEWINLVESRSHITKLIIANEEKKAEIQKLLED